MHARPLIHLARLALPVLLSTLGLATLGGVRAAQAAPAEPAQVESTPWSTDLDSNGSTGLADYAVFVCDYLGGCPSCLYTSCTPHVHCDPNCPPIFLACGCNSNIPVSRADFDCNGFVGLADFSIFAQAYLGGTVASGTCQ